MRQAFTALILGLLFAACGASDLYAAERDGPLRVTAWGEVSIYPEGSVRDVSLAEGLRPAIAAAVERAVRGWQFEPVEVEGRPVAVRTGMQLRLRLEPDGDSYHLWIDDVSFGVSRPTELPAPRYPPAAAARAVGANVLLALRLDENGRVVDAHAYQTSLSKRVHPNFAERLRQGFAAASIAAMKQSRFDVVETFGDYRPGATVMYRQTYQLADHRGRIISGKQFFPGPVHPVPWPEVDPENALAAAGQDSEGIFSLVEPVRLREGQLGKPL